MELLRIRPELYQINVHAWPIEAAESRLFAGYDPFGNKIALKVYRSLPLQQIQTYAEVTNYLAQTVNESGMIVRLNVRGSVNEYTVHIVPVSALGVVEDPDKAGLDLPCTLSPFIDGDSLFDLDRNFLSKHLGMNQKNPLFVLSQTLEKISNRNIAIIPWNVKPLEKEGQPILEVTDICGSIKSLE